MAASVLKLGSRGPDVIKLQNELNKSFDPSPKLVPDGDFGPQTARWVRTFQRASWLVEDGEAGQCTQNALFDTETYEPIIYKIPFIPQNTEMRCWAASTAMMTNSSMPIVINRTPVDLIIWKPEPQAPNPPAPNTDQGLKNFSEGSQDYVAAGQRFASANGIQMVSAAMSWTVDRLKTALRRGPVMFDMLWDSETYAKGAGSAGHVIVVVGMRGDDDPSGKGTTLRIHDPWPPNKGAIYSVGYFKWINEVTTRTYRAFQK